MDGKGFFHSTAALITALGTVLAALVALGVFLFGEGIFNSSPVGGGDNGTAAAKVEGKVLLRETLGRSGTSGIELDGSKIQRNPGSDDPDVVYHESIRWINVSRGLIVPWTEPRSPSQGDCAKLLDTHGVNNNNFLVETDSRFCIRSSGGRTAFLMVVNEGKEFDVSVWR